MRVDSPVFFLLLVIVDRRRCSEAQRYPNDNLRVDKRIFEGEEVEDVRKYPWTVKVMRRTKPLCSGSIIGRDKILTAAHCTCLHAVASDYGIYTLDDAFYRAKMIVLHPSFSCSEPIDQHGVAVLILESNIRYSSKARKVRLSFDPVLPGRLTKHSTKLVFTGFGGYESSLITLHYGTLRVGRSTIQYDDWQVPRYFRIGEPFQRPYFGDSGGPGVICGNSTTAPRPCVQVAVISALNIFRPFFMPIDMQENFINSYVPMIAGLPE